MLISSLSSVSAEFNECGCLALTLPQVVKNPLSPVEHPGGTGVNNELFEEGLEQFVV